MWRQLSAGAGASVGAGAHGEGWGADGARTRARGGRGRAGGMPTGGRPHLELIAEQGVFVSVEKLCPKLHGAGGDAAEVAHAPAHRGARLDDDDAPPPRPQRRLQRPRRPQPREARPHHHHGRLRRRRHPGPAVPRRPPSPGDFLAVAVWLLASQ